MADPERDRPLPPHLLLDGAERRLRRRSGREDGRGERARSTFKIYDNLELALALGEPMWKPGWQAKIRIRYDSDMMQAKDVMNLLSRAGLQVGICEGRPDSKDSCGMGWGTFRVLGEGEN